MSHGVVFIVSDSVGETADFVVRAAASQFDHNRVEIRRFPYVDQEDTIRDIVKEAADCESFIAYTLILPALRDVMQREAQRVGVLTVDIMGPMMAAFQGVFRVAPALRPGLLHRLDDEYFRRVEAVEFAVKSDDGRDARNLLRADVALIGVSRTSKTPLSMYLAHKQLRVANVPLLPESRPPEELFVLPRERVIGLTINAEQLYSVRRERLRTLGLADDASYAQPRRIQEELRFAESVMKKVGCRVIDVSQRAVEEIAGLILEHVRATNRHNRLL